MLVQVSTGKEISHFISLITVKTFYKYLCKNLLLKELLKKNVWSRTIGFVNSVDVFTLTFSQENSDKNWKKF